MITLEATKRTELGKSVAALYKADKMPAVLYGPKKDSEPVTISLPAFKKILREGNETAVVELSGLGPSMQVLIHEVYRDPVTNEPRHADFYAIEKGAKVQVAVPLTYIGESAAVKAGASLVKVMHELPVESDPSKLPHDIEVDITPLEEIGNQIHVSDIKLPSGVVATVEGEEVVALVQEVVEEVEETPEEPDMDAIEVEQKGKEEDGEGESEEKKDTE